MTPDRSLLVLARDALAYHVEQTRPIQRTTEALAALDAQLSQPEVPVTPRDSLLAEADILASEHPSKDVRWFADSVARYLRAQPEVPTPARGAEVVAWRTEAARWLRRKAAGQAVSNARWPRHAAAYPEWEKRVRDLEWLATELDREQAESPYGLDATPTAPTPAAQSEAPTNEEIDAAVYAQYPNFDDSHDGPSIDDVRAIVRAVIQGARNE